MPSVVRSSRKNPVLWRRMDALMDSVASSTQAEEYDRCALECHQLYCDVVGYLTGEAAILDDLLDDISESGSTVETPTDSLVEPLPDPNNWVAYGRVIDENGEGVEGVIVSLYDQAHLFDNQLGTTQTDAKGEFCIIYRIQDFRNLFEASPDLYLKVMDQQNDTLYSSESTVKAGAGRVEHFDDIRINRPNSGE